ncbi:MAG: DinB family protein [Bacteroidota bacterium]
MISDARLRRELTALLRGGNAHVPTLVALADVPAETIHERPDGFPHSLWDLLYHLWFTQHDILVFSRDPTYTEPAWPAGYWPEVDTPVEWDATLEAFAEDLEALVGLTETGDLFAEFEHAPGYTLLREVLLVADHNAHHLGQVIDLRRALGLWPPPSMA